MFKRTAIMFFVWVSLWVLPWLSYSQENQKISGKVLDEFGSGLPFTTIYVENTTNGSTSNVDGEFTITLSAGQTRLVFQYVGYQKKIIVVSNHPSSEPLMVQMQVESFNLKEFVISANQEDPAYRVIREAIKKRKEYQNEINAYQCDAYLKGLQAITKKPDKILGFAITIDSGIVYLSESVSKLSFQRPSKIREEMISSKVSGNNNAFSYNIASDVLFNPYQNLFVYETISERGFISPIATNALLFYDYELIGTSVDDNLLINKIKVIPKRDNDPVFSGTIYIIEDQWRMHSVDLLLTKANQIEFIDSIKVKQVYAPVNEHVWTLLSQRFEFNLNAFGFTGFGYFVGAYSNYQVEPNYILLAEKRGINIPEDQRVTLFSNSKKVFTNEILAINDQANKRDSSYWARVRPVPLTKVEKEDYIKGDSLNILHESKPYKDSIDRITNKLSIANLLLSGYVYSNSFKQKYLRFQSIPQAIQYNTVEGPVIDLRVSYSRRDSRGINHQIIPTLRYGIGNKSFTAHLTGFFHSDLKSFERFGLSGGKKVAQLNERNPIRPATNTFQTLIFRRNYIKLFDKWFIRPSYRKEITNGILLNASVEYARRSPLQNTSFNSFRLNNESRRFTSNDPINLILENQTSFETHEALISNLSIRFRFGQKYISRPNRKIIVSSIYPDITLSYKKGIEAFGSDINYDWVNIKVSNSTKLGLFGRINYSVEAGKFLNAKKLTFIDFSHFMGNRSSATVFGSDVLQLLDYYNLSTNDQKIEAHYEHHFNGFFINKIPLIRKSKIQMVFSFNYANTPSINGYYEFGASLEHIFKIVRIGYYTGFQNGENNNGGIRFGIGF